MLLAQIFITVCGMSVCECVRVCHEVFVAMDGVVCMDFGDFFALIESVNLC